MSNDFYIPEEGEQEQAEMNDQLYDDVCTAIYRAACLGLAMSHVKTLCYIGGVTLEELGLQDNTINPYKGT